MPTGNVFSIGAGLELQRIQGEITKITVDAILNRQCRTRGAGAALMGHAGSGAANLRQMGFCRIN